MPLDFTLGAFDEFCQRISVMPVFTVADYLTHSGPLPIPFAILRLDVDYRESHGVALARIARDHALRGSFYFRCGAKSFPLDAMREVSELGHEVGYHFETLDTCGGDSKRAEEKFLEHLAELRAAGLAIRTVAAHGSIPTAPTYRSNLDLFLRSPGLFERAGILGETTLSIDFSKVTYCSDATWRWHRYTAFRPGTKGRPTSLRAIMSGLAQFETGIYINFHPQQWFAHPASATYYRTRNRIGRRLLPVLRRFS